MATATSPCAFSPGQCVASSSHRHLQPAPLSVSVSVSGSSFARTPAPSQSLCASRQAPVKGSPRPLRVAAEGVTSETAEAPATTEAPKLLDVKIESELGQTYEVLQERLARGEWEDADKETRRLICVLAGEGAAKRKWVYFTEVQFMPVKDLSTIDRLWRAYSNDKFGFSIQRRIWRAMGQAWKPFFLKIDWTYGENSFYRKFPREYKWEADAVKGHLPLTNCLRGTQLLEALLKHPAFDLFDDEQAMPSDSELPEFSKDSMESGASSAPIAPPMGLTGSIFDEDFNSTDYGF